MNGWKVTIDISGFTMVFGLQAMVFQWILVPKPLLAMVFQWFLVTKTIGSNGFPMVSDGS